MSIYLIRHTAPLVEKGTCYGWADIGVKETFEAEAEHIKKVLPGEIRKVHSSPLTRCGKLASHLFPEHTIAWEPDLRELNCGEWELQKWDDIPREIMDPWMNDFVNVSVPGGESYVQLFDRVTRCFEKIAGASMTAAIVTHGGVIRSILAHITQTQLKDSFGAFKIHYGCVMRLDRTENGFRCEVLSNIPTEKEQHKPSSR
jgi:alpha-ribazole phosphatase